MAIICPIDCELCLNEFCPCRSICKIFEEEFSNEEKRTPREGQAQFSPDCGKVQEDQC